MVRKSDVSARELGAVTQLKAIQKKGLNTLET